MISEEKGGEFQKVVRILFDGEPWKVVHRTVFFRWDNGPFKSCRTIEEAEAVFEVEEYRRARNYALKKIAKMSLSTHHLKRLMTERMISVGTAERIVREFTESGYLNDEDWFESFYRGEIARKSGPGKIKMKLMQKGFDQETINRFMSEKEGEEEGQPVLIRRLLESRYRKRDLGDMKERQKVMAGLIRQGFDYEEIKRAISSNEYD